MNELAERIASFPRAGLDAIKQRVNAISLASVEEFRRDSELFGEAVNKPESQRRIEAAFKLGFQTPDAEMDWGSVIPALAGSEHHE